MSLLITGEKDEIIEDGNLKNLDKFKSFIGKEEKLFRCLYSPINCCKTYTRKTRLIHHLKLEHLKSISLLKCHYLGCTKEFNDQSNLNVHSKIHGNLKPHKCKFCMMTFITKSNKEDHQRRHTQFR